MSKSLTNPTFDYSQVTPDEKSSLIYFGGQVERCRKRAVEEVLRYGEMMWGAQQTLAQHNSGVFAAWLASIGVSSGSAYRAIDAYTAFGSDSNLESVEVSALYVLAKNEKAKKQALKLVDKGVRVTHAMAKELIEKSFPKPKNSTPKASAPVDDGEPFDESAQPIWEQIDELAKTMPDYGKCPNCAGKKWTETAEGVSCAKCNQPHGEPTGGADDDRVATQRSKTVKTVESLMRAFGDLQHICPRADHDTNAKACCDRAWEIAQGWK